MQCNARGGSGKGIFFKAANPAWLDQILLRGACKFFRHLI